MQEIFHRRAFLRAISGAIILATSLSVLSGCGSSNSPIVSNSPSASQFAQAKVNITWPAAASAQTAGLAPRLIPAAANAIKLDIKSGTTLVISQIVARPTTGNTTTTNFNQLPVGNLVVTATAYPTVDATGTAQAQGTAPLVTQVGQTANVSITMSSTITKIVLIPASITAAVGQTNTIVATPEDATGAMVLIKPNSLQYSIQDPTVASITTDGIVKALKSGTTTVTVTEPESTKTASLTVTVTSANIRGTVTDSVSAGVLAGVRVDSFDNNGALISTTTGVDGTYSLYVPPGQRVLVFSKSGYTTAQQTAVPTATVQTLDQSLVLSTAAIDTAPPRVALNAPAVDQGVGHATITGTITQGDGLGVIIVNGSAATFTSDAMGHFSYIAILQPGANAVRVAATNFIATAVSDPININYAPSGNVYARVTLTWDGPGDLDLHDWGPNGQHSSWHNKVIAAGNLDVDNTVGFGPEDFTFTAIVPGHYSVGVDAYSLPSATRNATIRVAIFSGVNAGQVTSYGPYTFTASNGEAAADYPVIGNTPSWWRPVDIDVAANGDISVTAPTGTSLPRALTAHEHLTKGQ